MYELIAGMWRLNEEAVVDLARTVATMLELGPVKIE